ncbi:psbP-like protein 1, chloroplastic isoform X2 [Selaginella moellendorffii]|uniref:psbP-like protein 1, chloroplastic isoform X2 n=1 Tax=Selaginella moellendorffii TaxID=88036 RepID=UPI000D1C2522|nr:psbP-like protein 1, chloroplastic isoform X2 [Selaginella moellendorffii]|eukprot:XP_024528072.1 psbP-like protein 1, chloroplastic isoform X2 [Selaginella moellendorffii]
MCREGSICSSFALASRSPGMAAWCGRPIYLALEPQVAAFYSEVPPALRGCPKTKQSIKMKSSMNLDHFDDRTKRRQILVGVGTLLLISPDVARAEKTPAGFKASLDKNDGYVFYYPFGWEEIVVKGQDVVYKDVIEPLESVSVNIVKTEKTDIHDFGPPDKLSKTLVEKFLTSPSQKTQVIEAKERETDGKPYYTFEFLAKDKTYTRHALAAVTVANGKFYALVTGANERRWNKMRDRLHSVVDSFRLLEY